MLMVPPAPSAAKSPPMPSWLKPEMFLNVSADNVVATEFFTMISFVRFSATPAPGAVVSLPTWASDALPDV